MLNIIDRFRGEYFFLSNFYPSAVEWDGFQYQTVEHAFQAAKSLDPYVRCLVGASVTPGAAKHIGRTIALRPDWEQVKVGIMIRLLRRKFCHPDLAEKLLATGDAYLLEGNTWGDTFWGAVKGKGQNMLGALLCLVRSELASGKLVGRQGSGLI